MENYGIKETKELLIFLARFGTAIDRALIDKKITWLDAGVLLEPLMASKAAFENVDMIPIELGELSSEEALELSDAVSVELDLSNNQAEYLTERGLSLATELIAYIHELRAAKNADPIGPVV